MKNNLKISVVVTVYSETYSLSETVRRLLAGDRGYVHEIILVVAPKSSKECFEVCDRLVSEYSVVSMHVQEKVPGVGWAIREGMKLSTGDYVVLISADLETEPEALDRMVSKIEETGCDGVIGNRWLPGGGFKNYDKTKLFLNYFFQKIFKMLFRTKLGDLTYGYKTLSKKICDDIKWEGTLHEIYIETTIKPLMRGFHIEQIPTIWVGRTEGESKNPFVKNFRYVKMAFKVLLSR